MKIRLQYKINYKKVLRLMYKSDSEKFKKNYKKNIKSYKPVHSPKKISQTM